MKVSNIAIVFLGVLLIAACGHTGKKEKSTTGRSGADVKLEATGTMDLEQKLYPTIHSKWRL
ncbi:MAG: hypothetical protein CMH46_14775 [Muricauda sp.]|nr:MULTISPECIES: hypothetical protein [unclassified Allomuricauda]MAU16790.1 hypothetical protein [Allomuricauda sp.]|tara:strand:+ start:20495 stop:20680 length:186 start_codon:yes stop_codon:yes gene_type:complete